MGKTAKALVSWVPASKGGRKAPPTGPSYSTLVRFQDDPTWPEHAWSLKLEVIHTFAGGQFVYAKVQFLTEEAPQDLLHSGSRFELYEGRRMVATGLVREDDEAPRAESEFEAALLH